VRVTHLDLLGLVEPLTCDVHLHDCVLQQGAGTRASPRPHPAASSRSLTRSRSTCVRTPSVATPAPRRQLTLAHALPLHLRANTQRHHARTPPPSHARSRAHAPRTREPRAPQRTHPASVARPQPRSRAPEPGIPGAAAHPAAILRSLTRSRLPYPEHPTSPAHARSFRRLAPALVTHPGAGDPGRRGGRRRAGSSRTRRG